MDDELEEELTPWGAFRRVFARWAPPMLVWFLITVAAWVGAFVGVEYDLYELGVASLIVAICSGFVGLVGVFFFPASVWQEVVESDRTTRRRMVEEATLRLGTAPLDSIELTTRDRLRQYVRDSRAVLTVAAVFEVMIVLTCILMGLSVTIDTAADVAIWAMSTALLALPLPLMFVSSIRKDLAQDDSESSDAARVEKAYREAVKGKEQLAGGLVLDEHAVRAGGALTMQQEAGGLEVHEEVALDFDAGASAEATSEEVVVAERAVDG